MSIEVTLIVVAHDQTLACGPTMRSAELAVAAAEEAGLGVERVVALAAATPATTEYFSQPRFDGWDRRTFDEVDPGLVANALVPEVEGRFVAFLGAGDLLSENWLADGARVLLAAAGRGDRVIAHPELAVTFDGVRSVVHHVAQDSALFTPHYLYARNLYDSLSLAPREAHLEVPYRTSDPHAGLGDEESEFVIATMARGWRHVVVPDTISFRRHRDLSRGAGVDTPAPLVRPLPELAIERVGDLGGRSSAQ